MMKVILLQHLSGAKTHEVGDEIEVTDGEALRFIAKCIAKAKTPKQHNDLVAKVEKIEAEEAEKKAKLLSIQKEEELKAEADSLLNDLHSVVTTLSSLDDKYMTEFKKTIDTRFKKGK